FRSEAFGDETPFIQTVFSPLAQARSIAGPDRLIEHMRTAPDRLKTGLATITESTLRFIEAMRRSGVAGIYYAIQHASYAVMSESEYLEFGRPYDLRVLEALPPEWWFNMAHLHGRAPMLNAVKDYPLQALNWHDRESDPDLANGKVLFPGAVSGGMGRMDPMHTGTPVEVRSEAGHATDQTNAGRFCVPASCR